MPTATVYVLFLYICDQHKLATARKCQRFKTSIKVPEKKH